MPGHFHCVISHLMQCTGSRKPKILNGLMRDLRDLAPARREGRLEPGEFHERRGDRKQDDRYAGQQSDFSAGQMQLLLNDRDDGWNG